MKSRVDKILASSGFGSRRDIKRLLRTGLLTINGSTCRDPAQYADPETDTLLLDGELIQLHTQVYLMLNKPSGVVTSTSDPVHRTVLDLLGEPWSTMDLFPVGRLDVTTEGLLLLTNDGKLAHRLLSPRSKVPKRYAATLRDPVDEGLFRLYQQRFAEGVSFHDGYTCLPAEIERLPGDRSFAVTIHEGKYHQVKKMFRVVDNYVEHLVRLSMGPIVLDPGLAPGCVRELTVQELESLRLATGELLPE